MADEEGGDVQEKKPGLFENKIVVVTAIVVMQAATPSIIIVCRHHSYRAFWP